MSLSFFLQQQKKILILEENVTPLQSLKTFCLKHRHSLRRQFSVLSHWKISDNYAYVCLCPVEEDEFKPFFPRGLLELSQPDEPDIFVLFASPLGDHWKNVMLQKRSNSYVVKFGFFQCEYSIYLAARDGFQCVTIFVHELDKYQIQYLTEVGREAGIDIIFLIQQKAELDEVLETDAPYFAFFCFDATSFTPQDSFSSKCVHLVPKGVLRIAFAAIVNKESYRLYKQLGFDLLFCMHS